MMNNHKFLTNFLFVSSFVFAESGYAQVPVREEPRHHVALQNQYVRVLDVRIPPGDTTLFHIHATPSLFVMLSATRTATQVKGENWTQGTSVAGTAWYNSFTSGALIHRLTNIDTGMYHPMDIELLSAYNNTPSTPLPFDTIFTNQKAFAYRLTFSNKNDKKQISDRGPIIAVVVSGPGINAHFSDNKTQNISHGQFIWIEPQTKCSLVNNGKGETSVVMFELK